MIRLAQPKWILGVSIVLLLWGVLLTAGSRRTERLARDLPRMTCDDLLQMGKPRRTS